MAQDIPPKAPEWASNPSPAPPTIITEPLQAEKEAGWLPGQPFREYVNWWWNLVYQWVVWLNQTTFRFDIFGVDQGIPGAGSIPPVGGGSLARGAADFSGRAVAGGYLTQLVDGPAFVYTANTATFWNLRRDGAWVPQVVPLPVFFPPIKPADSARIYQVDTDGTEPIAVFDFRPDALVLSKPFSFARGQKFGHQDTQWEAASRLTLTGTSANEYTLIDEYTANGALRGSSRLYVRSDGIPIMVRGASYDGAGFQTWTIDPNHVGDVQYTPLDAQGFNAKHLAQSVGSPFADSLWFADADLAGNLDRELVTDGTIRAGAAFAASAVVGAQSNLPAFVAGGTPAKPERQYTLNSGLGMASVYTLLANPLQGTAGAERGLELVSNCKYDGPSALWLQTLVGADCFKWEISSVGARLLFHAAANGATWADTIAPGAWTVLWSVQQPLDKWIPASRFHQRALGGVSWDVLAFSSLASLSTELNAIQKDSSAVNAPLIIWFEETEIPQGAIIDQVDLVVTPNEANGQVNFAVVRVNVAAGTHESFVDGVNGQETATGGAKQTIPLTIAVSEAIRTVDRQTYRHGLWLSASLLSTTIVHGVRVRYRVT